MKKVCDNDSINLPKEGDYGVGMLFLSPDTDTRMNSLAKLQGIIEEEGMEYLGYREVPTYSECIGASAREAMPHIVQVFIKRPEDVEAGMAFERKLFVVLNIVKAKGIAISILHLFLQRLLYTRVCLLQTR